MLQIINKYILPINDRYIDNIKNKYHDEKYDHEKYDDYHKHQDNKKYYIDDIVINKKYIENYKNNFIKKSNYIFDIERLNSIVFFNHLNISNQRLIGYKLIFNCDYDYDICCNKISELTVVNDNWIYNSFNIYNQILTSLVEQLLKAYKNKRITTNYIYNQTTLESEIKYFLLKRHGFFAKFNSFLHMKI